MQRSKHFIVSVLILGAYLLSACNGTPSAPRVMDDSKSGQTQDVVFTGAVEAIGDGQWTVNGQVISVDAVTSVDANVKVGDTVRVEATVGSDGSVMAVKIEGSAADDANANSNGANANDDNSNVNTNTNANTNDNTNSADDNRNGNANANGNEAPAGPEQEAFGVVEALTADSVTINGITYKLANFTEFKNGIAVGDQVKIHVIVNADGSLTIREIEKSSGPTISGDDNSNGNSNDSNSNVNGSDDNSNHNSNDDSHSDDNSNSNSNDDHGGGGDSNSNSNSNDD